MSKEVKPYKYFDTPDGEDILPKLIAAMKPTSLIAFGISTTDVMLYSHPKGYLKTLGRYAFIGLPIMAIGATFVLTTNLVTNVRKQEDKLNWFIGGAAAGSVFGPWSRKPMVGFNMAILFGLIALGTKHAREQGWEVIRPNKVPIANMNVWDWDFSLSANRPGNWTRTRE